MNITGLLERAKRGVRVETDRDLDRKTGVPANCFPAWRRGHRFPSDESMVKLCAAAEVDPVPWLIWLNVQRSDGEVSKIYERHLAQVTRKKPANGSQVIAA